MIILPIPFPIKAKWALLGLAVLDLMGGVSSQSTGIAHFAHLGGAAVGILICNDLEQKQQKTLLLI